jgi:hypothetical protein
MGGRTHYICSQEVKYHGIVGGEVDMPRDMKKRFNGVIIEEGSHFTTTVWLI